MPLPRSQHRSSGRRRRRVKTIVAASLLLLAVALVVGIRTWRAEPEVTALATQDYQMDTAMEAFSALASAAEAEVARPVYQYSVVPGGTYTRDELKSAIENDAVVAAHYKTLDQSRLRTEVVPQDKYVHVSYRKGNDVFWTSKKVLLREGETILTDGTTQVRARCGNCISEEPLGPTAAHEPDVVEFDRLVADTPSPLAGEPSLDAPTFPVPPIVSGREPFAVGPFAPGGGGTGGSGAPGPSAAGGAPPSGGVGSPDPLAAARPAGEREPGSPDSPGAPGSPGSPDSPSSPGNNPWSDPPNDVPPGFPGDGTTPLDDIDPFPLGPDGPGGPLDPPLIPPTEPFNPVPVPEPGTLLLVGGGVAALVRKFRSRER